MNRNTVTLMLGCVSAIAGVAFMLMAHDEDAHTVQTGNTPMSAFCEAMLAKENGNLIKAERLWRESVQRSPTTEAGSALCLGGLLRDEGRFVEAEKFLKLALDIDTKLFGQDSVEVTTPTCELAALYEQEGKFQLAQSLLTQVIHTCAKNSKRKDAALQSAYAMSSLARIYEVQGHSELITPALKKSKMEYKRLLQATNPSPRDFKLSLARASKSPN